MGSYRAAFGALLHSQYARKSIASRRRQARTKGSNARPSIELLSRRLTQRSPIRNAPRNPYHETILFYLNNLHGAAKRTPKDRFLVRFYKNSPLVLLGYFLHGGSTIVFPLDRLRYVEVFRNREDFPFMSTFVLCPDRVGNQKKVMAPLRY